jgi:hypothetical protein
LELARTCGKSWIVLGILQVIILDFLGSFWRLLALGFAAVPMFSRGNL